MPINPTKSDAIRRGGRGSTAAWEVIGVFDTDGDGECADWVFPEEPGAVRSARAAVRGQLGVWGLDSLGDVTELLVSELVTNALRHASGPIGVRLLRSAEPPTPCGWRSPIIFRIRRWNASRGRRRKAGGGSSWSRGRRGGGGRGPVTRARRSGSNCRCPAGTDRGRHRWPEPAAGTGGVAPVKRNPPWLGDREHADRRRGRPGKGTGQPWIWLSSCYVGTGQKASGPWCDREHRVARLRSAGYCGQPPR